MNVRLTQINCRIEQIVNDLKEDGVFPDSREVAAIARSQLKVAGSPSIELMKFREYSAFPAEEFIQLMKDASFDLVVIRKTLLSFYDQNRSEFIKNSTRYRKIVQDIEEIENEIKALQGISDGQYSDYIYEPFTNTNQVESGLDSVDLDYGKAQLPIKRNYTSRVPFNFEDSYSPRIEVTGPSVRDILYSGSVAGSRFSSAFTDVNHGFIHVVKVSDYSSDVTVEFIIPFPKVICSQVSISPFSNTPIDLSIQYTEDGVNYSKPDLSFSNGSELQFRFESKVLSGIKVRATISDPSYIIDGISEYVFGFLDISAINALYVSSSIIETKYSKSSFDNAIKSIEIESEEVIPDGCSVLYSVKGKSYNGVETEWISVDPIGRILKESPTVIELSGSSKVSHPLLSNEVKQQVKFEEIDFYDVGHVDPSHNIDLKSIKLFRSISGWKITDESRMIESSVQTHVDLRKDRDVPIHFYTSELALYVSVNTLSVRHDIDFNEAGQELIPRSKDEIDPGTAILSVKRVSFASPIGYGSKDTGDNYQKADGVVFPVLEPFVFNKTVTPPDLEAESIINPNKPEAPADIFSIDTTTAEEIIVRYVNGGTSVLKFSVRASMRIKQSTQPSDGAFIPRADFFLTDPNYISIVDADGNEKSFTQVSFIEGEIGSSNVQSIVLNSHSLPSSPPNTGAETRGFRLIPTDDHASSSPDMFMVNDISDMPTPFPVKISTDTFSGVYEVDRISSIQDGDGTKPVLIITNPEKLGGFIPTASQHLVTSWEIISQDLTSEVELVSGDKITFSDFVSLNPLDRIEVSYRVSSASSTVDILPETIVAKDSQSGQIFKEGLDFLYKDGLIHSFKEDIIQDLLLQFSYKTRANNVYRAETYLNSLSVSKLEVEISSFGNTNLAPDYDAGESVLFDGLEVTVDSVIPVTSGWHKIVVISKDLRRLVSLSNALDSLDRSIFSVSNIFSSQRAIYDPLTYVDYDTLKWSSYKASPLNFSILDGKVIVPFNPFSNAFSDNNIYKVYKGEDLEASLGQYYIDDITKIEAKAEKFHIEYDYSKVVEDDPEASLIEFIKTKIELKRSTNENSALTPLVDNFRIRIL